MVEKDDTIIEGKRETAELDWPRIRHLMKLGLIAGCMNLAGDLLLGYGVSDPSQAGLAGMLSAYVRLSDARIFWSSFLGFIGIPLEGLCCFAIYRLIKPYSEKHAHLYRSGIIGYVAFAGCGVHVPCLASVFFYKYMMQASPETALDAAVRFGAFFLLPGMVAYSIFWFIQSVTHILAFSKGLTPYPKWCWIFCIPVGMVITSLFNLFGNQAWVNAITAGWISIGNIWMFGGLLFMMRKAEQ
ncbi:MAG: hypothetical protein IJQ12_00840 [Lachnospiraceae bacterium]|nr:hypothetical protein [Lachnospiraceae bacterium]